MFKEVALDPTAWSSWSAVRQLAPIFGPEKGRFISAYPKKYVKRVIDELPSGLGPVERKRVVEKVRRLESSRKLVSLARGPFDGSASWFDNVRHQHDLAPFDLIAMVGSVADASQIVCCDDLDDDDTPELQVDRTPKVRTASVMTACADIVLRASHSIRLVDPYFHPAKPRFRNPLIWFLRIAEKGRPLRSLEYHIAFSGQDELKVMSQPDFQRNCDKWLEQRIPAGLTLTIHRWGSQWNYDDMHPRYILTDCFGLSFEHGLDEGHPGDTTDVHMLSEDLRVARWADYSDSSSPFSHIDSVTIVGR